MSAHSFQRFDRSSVRWFYRAFGMALLVNVLFDLCAGTWRVHKGELYPWHQIPVLPLYGTGLLTCEWLLASVAGVMLALQLRVVLAVRMAAVATFAGLTQRFSNHGALLFIVAVLVALAPPDVREPDFDDRLRPNMALVRAQIAIVYFFSAANKIASGFLGGGSLEALFGFSRAAARPLSWALVATELALPVVLFLSPRVGIVGVMALHLVLALMLPGLGAFGLVMVAMALLYLRMGSAEASRLSGPPLPVSREPIR